MKNGIEFTSGLAKFLKGKKYLITKVDTSKLESIYNPCDDERFFRIDGNRYITYCLLVYKKKYIGIHCFISHDDKKEILDINYWESTKRYVKNGKIDLIFPSYYFLFLPKNYNEYAKFKLVEC